MWIFSCQLWAQRGLVPPAVCDPSPAASMRRCASPRPAGPQHQTSRRANRHTQRRVGCRSARSVLRARSPAAPAEAVLCGTSRERAGGRHHSAKLGSPSVAPAGGGEAGHGLSGWPASPRPGALPVAGAAQSRSLWGLSPGAECLPSRHGAKAMNGQFRAVKLQTADKYVETGDRRQVIPTTPATASAPSGCCVRGPGRGEPRRGLEGARPRDRPLCSR